MADVFVGQAWVQIAPSFTGFQRAISQEMERTLGGVGQKAGADFGKALGDGVARATGNGKGIIPTRGMTDEAGSAGRQVADRINDGIRRISAKAVDVTTNAIVGLGKAAAVAGGVATAAFLGFAAANAQTYTRAKQFENAMSLVGDQMGVSNDVINAGVKRMVELGSSTQNARSVMMQFVRTGGDATRAWELYARAEDIAVTTGRTGNEVIQELIYGLQTGNTNLQIFRTIGLNATDAQDQFARQIGKTRDQLTDAEKQQALFNGVMEKTGNIAGVAGRMMAEGPFNWAAFQAPIQNLKEAMGSLLEPAFSAVGRSAFNLTKEFTAAIGEGGKLEPVMATLRDIFRGLAEPIARVIDKIREWLGNLGTEQVQRLADRLKDLAPIIPAIAGALTAFAGQQATKNIPIIGNLVGSLNPLHAGLIGLALGFPPVRDALGQLMTKIAPLIPKIVSLASRLVDVLMKGVTPLIDALLKLVDAALEPLMDIVEALIPVIGLLLDAFGPVLRIVVELVAEFLKFIAPVLKPLIIAIIAITAAWWLWNAALAVWAVLTSPVNIVLIAIVAAIAAIIAIIALLVRHWDTIWKAMLSVVQTVWRWIQQYWPILLTILLGPIGLAISLIIKNFDTLKNAVIAAWNAMCTAIEWAWENILKPVWDVLSIALRILFAVTIAPILIAIYLAWQVMSWAIEAAWRTIIKPAWDALQAALQWLWNRVVAPIIAEFQAKWDALSSAIAWAWNNVIRPAWNTLQAALQTLWNATVRPIINAFQSAWDGLGSSIRWVWENVIRPTWDRIREGLDSLQRLFQGAVRVITEAWDGLKEAIAAPARWVVSTIINPLIRGANKLLDLISLGIPEIPAFAGGGRVPGGWGGGDRQLLWAEPGEWILTKRQARAFGYTNLSNLPRYAEGGEVGRYGAAVDPWALFTMGPLDWARRQAKKVGGFITAPFDELLELGKGALNSVTKMFRAAAAKAFEVGTLPLRKILEEHSDVGPPAFWLGAVSRFGIRLIDAAIEFIRGKSEPEYVVGGMGIDDIVAQVIAQFPQLRVTSALRPGDPGYHGKNLARDLGGPVSVMNTAGGWIQQHLVSALLEGIYNPTLSVKNGKVVPASFWGAGTWAAHQDHIHLASEAGMAIGGDVGSWLAEAIRLTGVNPAVWMGALAYQVQRESGGNPRAINNWDINAQRGTPSKGILQVIDPTFAAYMLPGLGDIWNPIHNAVAAIRYIIGRYGASASSLGRWRPGGGYDDGGFLPPGVSLAINNTGRPEPVLTAEQWDRIVALAERGSAPVVAIERAEFREEADIELLMRRAAWAIQTGAV
jgi:phage-related protein